MSVYTYVYLGPYAEISTKLTFERQVRCDNRSDQECPWPKASSLGTPTGFCSVCGMDSAKRVVEKWVPETDCDIRAETSHALEPLTQRDVSTIRGGEPKSKIGVRTHQIIPQAKREGAPVRGTQWEARCFHGLTVDLEDVAVAKEKEWMRFAFGFELSRLEELFGNLDVKWGMIIYGY